MGNRVQVKKLKREQALNNSSSNAEVLEVYGEELKTGKMVVFAKVEVANGYTNVYVAQLVNDLPAEGGGTLSKFEAEQIDANGILLRARFNTAHGDDFYYGDTIEGARIKVIDSLDPFIYQDGTTQSPRITRDGRVRLHNGDPIYRNTQVVYDDEFDGHEVIETTGFLDPDEKAVEVERAQRSKRVLTS